MKQFEFPAETVDPETTDEPAPVSLEAYVLDRPSLMLSFIDLAERFGERRADAA